jgi:PAS domain S-box-containing protein
MSVDLVAELRAEIAGLRERLEAQARMASYHHDRFEFLAASLPQQVWTALPSGQLDYVNPRVTDYFGHSAAKIIGDGWKDSLHPEDLAGCGAAWGHSLSTGEPYEFEFRLKRKDGVYRWHMARAIAQRDGAGKLVRWYGTNTDITDLKEALARLGKSR